MEPSVALISLIYPQKQLLLPRALTRALLVSFMASVVGATGYSLVAGGMASIYVAVGLHFFLWLTLVPFSYRDPFLFYTLRRKLVRKHTRSGIIAWVPAFARSGTFY